MMRWGFLSAVGLSLLGASCSRESERQSAASAQPTVTATHPTIYQVKGVVIEVKAAEKTVKIRHEEIPGYMAAMTMPFEVKDANELSELEAGDSVSFRMIVTDRDAWIDQIRRLGAARDTNLPTAGPFRLVREVEPLKIGDPLPEYHFTNELGQAVRLSQFRGKALAITFIYTRCPYPTFCPRTASNFEATQQQLLSLPNAATNWHLLMISFDPEFDTPSQLKAFGQRFQYNPNHWSLLTGKLIDLTALAEQFGLLFWHDGPVVSHNLRTVVVDTRGRVQTILRENKWKPEELAAEILKAAAVKP